MTCFKDPSFLDRADNGKMQMILFQIFAADHGAKSSGLAFSGALELYGLQGLDTVASVSCKSPRGCSNGFVTFVSMLRKASPEATQAPELTSDVPPPPPPPPPPTPLPQPLPPPQAPQPEKQQTKARNPAKGDTACEIFNIASHERD